MWHRPRRVRAQAISRCPTSGSGRGPQCETQHPARENTASDAVWLRCGGASRVRAGVGGPVASPPRGRRMGRMGFRIPRRPLGGPTLWRLAYSHCSRAVAHPGLLPEPKVWHRPINRTGWKPVPQYLCVPRRYSGTVAHGEVVPVLRRPQGADATDTPILSRTCAYRASPAIGRIRRAGFSPAARRGPRRNPARIPIDVRHRGRILSSASRLLGRSGTHRSGHRLARPPRPR